ncbi:MAG: methionine synthase [Prevotella sp.]|nr:methionine synthase [Bacteroides sp.]MCM1366927.1 methionine synthase [Prevotella sp.]MCM1437458.1 methionine synthase [Prevotella sp.]
MSENILRMKSRFEKELGQRLLVLDGAMGTMIQRLGLEESDFRGGIFGEEYPMLKGCNDVLVITSPEKIYGIHREYLESGADIIETDTFNSNRISLGEYGLGGYVRELNEKGAQLAVKAVDDFCLERGLGDDERPFVAGSMGPSGKSLTIELQEDVAVGELFDDMADAYCEQATALIDGGVDVLLLETIFDTLNAKAAVYGIKRAFRETGKRLPLMLSVTLTEQGRLLSGESLDDFVVSLEHSGAVSIGLNCGFGAEALVDYVRGLVDITEKPLSVHPNAGLPDAMGMYTESARDMSAALRPLIEEGVVDIVGGCCGTTPEHIRSLSEMRGLWVKGDSRGKGAEGGRDFLKVGERCNVAGSRKFLRLIKEGNWRETLDIAKGQLDKGAEMLDINMDDPMLDAKVAMVKFLRLLKSDRRMSGVPLMIDSSDFDVIREALRMLPIKGIVNSISLKNGEDEFLRHAREINDLGASMVVMAFDERGQADTVERRIEICSRAYKLLTESGIPEKDIIFDPNVLAISTGMKEHDRYAMDFLEATSWIKRNLPGARVSGGVSNLSFSYRGMEKVRKGIHSLFLEGAISSGMDMAIINPSTPLGSGWMDGELKEMIGDVLYCRREDASERLLAKGLELKRAAELAKGKCVSQKPDSGDKVTKSVSEEVSEMIVTGESEGIEDVLQRAVAEIGSAMEVVNRSLMSGMNRVGEMFGNGEMFLPQVVRSASVMKRAVEILTPYIESEQRIGDSGDEVKRPLIVLATVKGDVHDIGKNIVATVMRCSGFDVEDMGVMTPPESIVSRAKERGASAIGLSGLITPSLHEMGVVASMMEESGMRIPLFVGGATTSELHTAVKIAPCYSGAVVHTGDAASLPGAVKEFIGEESDKALAELAVRQERIREDFNGEGERLSLMEARKRRFMVSAPSDVPRKPGAHILEIGVEDIEGLINWRAMLSEWKLDPNGDDRNQERNRLLGDAHRLLGKIEGKLKCKVMLLPSVSEMDDIVVDCNGGKVRLPMLRSIAPQPVSGMCLSQSDYLRAEGDWLGVFVVTTAGSGIPELIEKLRGEDEYEGLLLQSLSHRLAEAGTEYMHRLVREELWGLPEGCGVRPAVGYASMPDQSLVFELDKLLDYRSFGVKVTEHGALWPSSTTTGLIFGNKESRYISVGELSEEQKREYAGRRGMSEVELSKYL